MQRVGSFRSRLKKQHQICAAEPPHIEVSVPVQVEREIQEEVQRTSTGSVTVVSPKHSPNGQVHLPAQLHPPPPTSPAEKQQTIRKLTSPVGSSSVAGGGGSRQVEEAIVAPRIDIGDGEDGADAEGCTKKRVWKLINRSSGSGSSSSQSKGSKASKDDDTTRYLSVAYKTVHQDL